MTVQRAGWIRAVMAVSAMVALSGCGRHATTSSGGPLNYYRDIKPIVDAKCATCHTGSGIAPFGLTTADEVVKYAPLMKAVIESGKMPPWPPDDTCNQYLADRSLSQDDKTKLLSWLGSSMPLGDSSQTSGPKPSSTTGMSRVDFTLKMPVPYTPQISPDDYRCFLVDWPETTTKYVTGFGVHPGDPQIVHHVIAYLATPDTVATYEKMDGTDGKPGWTCFGGPGGDEKSFGWLGAWAPGTLGSDFPANTGVQVVAGSKVIIQVHYNTVSAKPAPDQTSLNIEVADSVQHQAFVLPYTNPNWVTKHTMNIPANNPDVDYSFDIDLSQYLSYVTQGAFVDGSPFTIYASALHMHTRGSHATISIIHPDKTNECLLSIPHWDFNWQGMYGLEQPVVFHPGDQLSLDCHWDNSAAHQPVVNGVQVTPTDLNWGETTEDEMCLGILYVTQ